MNLTEEQQRFFDLLMDFPKMSIFWNRHSKEVDIDKVSLYLSTVGAEKEGFLRFLWGYGWEKIVLILMLSLI